MLLANKILDFYSHLKGEFGVVYKALLHGWKEYMYCLVAMKTLKGI